LPEKPKFTLEDIILPKELKEKILDVAEYAQNSYLVFKIWGLEETHKLPQTSHTQGKGEYVGTYNSGMRAYIVPGTLQISSDRKNCNVRIFAEGNTGNISYLDYHLWKEGNSLNFSNSEGYSGTVTSNMHVENKIWEFAQKQK